jgi:hypothetical protein
MPPPSTLEQLHETLLRWGKFGCLGLPDYLKSKPFLLDLCILADVLALIKARGAANLVDALLFGSRLELHRLTLYRGLLQKR